MVSRVISIVLIGLLQGTLFAETQTQSSPQTPVQMQQVLRKAQAKDKAVNITLNKQIDNRNKVKGKVSEVTETSFTIADAQTRSLVKMSYDDVLKVSQAGVPKAVWIVLGVAAAVIIGVATIYASDNS